MASLLLLALATLAQLPGTTATLRIVQPTEVEPGFAPEGTPVALHGKLSVMGNQVVDEHGSPTQLRGMSLFWSQWEGEYWNADAIAWLVSDWDCSLIRAALAVEHGGYLENPIVEREKMRAVVEACIANGIYVIIDWHDHHADRHLEEASAFFSEFAEAYGEYPNVLFETWNEPLQVDWGTVIKPFHEQILPAIRNHSDGIVILGTNTWSQDVDVAADDPVEGENLAYTLHFYAATHKDSNRQKAVVALSKGAALVVTEWGTCDSTGNGTLDLDSSREWIRFMDEYNLSHANWAVSDKHEACSALLPGAAAGGGWGDANLTPSGYYVRLAIKGQDDGAECRVPDKWPCLKPLCGPENSACVEEKCCEKESQQCFEKDAGWAQCMNECGDDMKNDGWSCEVLGGEDSGTQALWRPSAFLLLAFALFIS